MVHNITDNGAVNLACSIIAKAATDYKKALKTNWSEQFDPAFETKNALYGGHCGDYGVMDLYGFKRVSRTAQMHIADCEKFFRSDWFISLSSVVGGLDGERVINVIRERARAKEPDNYNLIDEVII